MKQVSLYISLFLCVNLTLQAQNARGELKAAAFDSLRSGALTPEDFDTRFQHKLPTQDVLNQLTEGASGPLLFEKKSEIQAPIAPSQAKLVEDCTNGIDDDGDGFVDCFDVDCSCLSGVDCSVETLPSDFKARLAWRSTTAEPSVTATPMVANLNPWVDNMPEIVVPVGGRGNTRGTDLLIFKGDGSNKNNPKRLPIAGSLESYPATAYAIGDMNSDGVPELVVISDDNKMRIYTNYQEANAIPMTLWLTSTQNAQGGDARPNLADFNGDGMAEIYVGSQIYKIVTTNPANPILSLVLDGPSPEGQCYYNTFSQNSYNSTAIDMLSPADCNGDPDCNGLELVCGTVIYSVDVDPNDGDGYQIKAQKDLNLLTSGAIFRDGYSAVADMDLDGELDIIVTGGRGNAAGVYIWNRTGLIGFYPYPNTGGSSGSLACVANIYDDKLDGYAEDYPEVLLCNSYYLNCFNLNKARTTPNNGFWWVLETNDFSGFTGSTFYDFNGDGFSEIVYRDEDHIRILYGGKAPFPAGVDAERNWFKYPCGSITADEYPIVADVDNDGEAEIAVTGYSFAGYNNPSSDYRGHLNIFESDAEPWLPCRKIWNQYNYFIVNINDDLSIPTNQQLHHLEFPAVGSDNRPFNKYLAQRQQLNEDFEPFLPVPDAVGEVQSIECKGQDSILIYLEVCNTGSNRIRAGMPIAFYSSNPSQTAASLYDKIHFMSFNLLLDSCVVLPITLPRPPNGVKLFGVVNDDGTLPRPYSLLNDFLVTSQPECMFENNIFDFDFSSIAPPLFVSQDTATCPGGTAVLSVQSTHNSYLWSNGSTGSSFTATSPGQYWVQVADDCAVIQRDTITVIEKILAPITLPNVGICPSETVNMSIDATYANVTWSLNGSPLCNNCNTFDFSPSSNLTLDIAASQSGCPVTGTVDIIIHAEPNLQMSSIDGTCDGTSAQAVVQVANPTNPLSYIWSSGANTATSIEAQSGTVTVTVTDGNGCVSTGSVLVDVGTALAVEADFPLIQCHNDLTSISLSMLSGSPPLTYLWSNSSTASGLQNVTAGLYSVTVTDAVNCKKLLNLDIIQPSALLLDTMATNLKCFGDQTARLNILAQGGTAPFSYQWSDGTTNSDRTNLGAGQYAVTVTDARGCTENLQTTISEPPKLVALDAQTEPSCPSAQNGTINFAGAQHGTAPYSYFWSNGATSVLLDSLASNAYTVTVSDANGCKTSKTFQVQALEAPILETKLSPVLCFGGQTGAIALEQLSGASDATFLWSNGISGLQNPQLLAGDYIVTVSYGVGKCAFEKKLTITEPPLFEAAIKSEDLPCFGSNSATLQANPSGGSFPYTYLWSSGANSRFIDSLPAGNYAVTLTDAHGCTSMATTTLVQPTELLALGIFAEPICPDSLDGQVRFEGVTQGTPPYTYLWSNDETDLLLENVAADTYVVTATDANGCTVERSITVEAVEKPVLDTQQGNAACFGENTGFISLAQLSGSNDATYLWSNGVQGLQNSQIAAGDYTVTVSFGVGKCAFEKNITIDEPPFLNLSSLSTAVRCFGDTNGTVLPTQTGGTPPYQFAWSNGANSPTLNQVSTGTYSLTLTDNNACTALSTSIVESPTAIEVLGATSTPTCPNVSNGSLVWAGAQQGTGTLSYLWNTGATDLILHNLPYGQYTVTVMDGQGCTASRSFDVPILDAIILDTLVQQISCFGAADGQILVSQIGGASDATFTWQNGTTNMNLQNLSAGSFDLEAVYGNGTCLQQWPFSIIEPPLLGLNSPFLEQVACFGATTGSIQTAAYGGTEPYNYTWSNAAQSPSLNTLKAGNYQLTLSDANGCTETLAVDITEPPLLIASTTFAADTCEAGTGAVTVEATGGFGLYAVLWSSGATNTSLENLSPENYSVTITDANGCTTSQQVVVPQYGLVPTVSATGDTITCLHPIAQIKATADQTGLTYQWLGASPNLPANASVSTSFGGSYQVLVSNSFGCKDTASAFVALDTLRPTFVLDDSIIRIPCGKDSINLQATGVSQGAVFSQSWTYLSNATPQNIGGLSITADKAGLYRFLVKNNRNGCFKSDTVLVEKPNPLLVFSDIEHVSCFGAADGTATIQIQSGGSLPFRYALDNGAWTDAPYFSNIAAGAHILQVADAGDCAWETAFELSQPDSFWVDLKASDSLIFLHQKVDLQATYGPLNSVLIDVDWTPSYGNFNSFALSQFDLPITDTEYVIRLVDANGCIATDRVFVEVENIQIWAPNVIDPKNGENRAFTLYTGEDISEIKILRIFDRWGTQVFENKAFKPNDISVGWDGTFKGQEENPAVFVWYAEVELADGRAFLVKGDVLVLR